MRNDDLPKCLIAEKSAAKQSSIEFGMKSIYLKVSLTGKLNCTGCIP